MKKKQSKEFKNKIIKALSDPNLKIEAPMLPEEGIIYQKKTMLRAAAEELQQKKMIQINLKLFDNELAKMKEDANNYYLGNLSAWIRYCCLNYRPGESELTEISIPQ